MLGLDPKATRQNAGVRREFRNPGGLDFIPITQPELVTLVYLFAANVEAKAPGRHAQEEIGNPV